MAPLKILNAAAALLSTVFPALGKPTGRGCEPDTVDKKVFDWTVTWEDYAPDGFTRKMMLVNGQTPGPVLEIQQGDIVVINLHNESPQNTSLHFHGIEMHGTPWSDGVPGVTQLSIEPGESFKYEWVATQHGSYWYHAHSLGQIEDGFYGAILIHPEESVLRPFEMISKDKKTIEALQKAEMHVHPLLISDFTHLTSSDKWDKTVQSKIEDTCYDSIVFNGKGRVECLDPDLVAKSLTEVQKRFLGSINATMTDKSCLPAAALDAASHGGAGDPDVWPEGVFYGCVPTKGSIEFISVEHRPMKEGQWVAIDLIGAINFITSIVSIDEHDMWVYATDGSYIEPQKVQALFLTSGDRYSVLVHTKKPGDYKIRVTSNKAPQIITGHAILSVGGSRSEGPPESTAHIDLVGRPTSDDVVFFDHLKAAPFPPSPIPQNADGLYRLNMFSDGASYLWALNSSRLMPSDLEHKDPPTLFSTQPYVANNVTLTTKNNTWIDLVFFAAAFPMPLHPIHKHGNKLYEIGRGLGDWHWTSVEDAMKEIPESFNLENPPLRDTVASPEATKSTAWTVVRYHVSNPGPWLLHCHINNHVLGGMMVFIQDGIDVWPEVPDEYQLP